MNRKYIDIVFDAPPAPESGRFIEVEDEQQRSISVGDWVEDGDLWRLRISEPYQRITELETEVERLRELHHAQLESIKEVDRLINKLIRLDELGITEQDIAETQYPKPQEER